MILGLKNCSTSSNEEHLGTKGSIAGIIQGQGVAVGPICIGAQGPSGRKSFENVSEEAKHDFRDSSRSHDYPRSTTNDNYVDENYLLQGGSTTRHTTKKVSNQALTLIESKVSKT